MTCKQMTSTYSGLRR